MPASELMRAGESKQRSSRPVLRTPKGAAFDFEDQNLLLGAILLIALLVYLRSLGNGFVWDDGPLIVRNHSLGQWSFLWQAFKHSVLWPSPWSKIYPVRYRPVVGVFFALNYHLFGLNPAGWHAMAVAVHLVAVAISFKIAARLTGRPEVAVLAALLFALIPVNAEAVAWISGSGLALAAAFELGAFYLFLQRERTWRRNWALALMLYAFALLSHEMAVGFAVMIASYVFLLESPRRVASAPQRLFSQLTRAVACAAPFLAEVLLYFTVRRLLFGSFLPKPQHTLFAAGMRTFFNPSLAKSVTQALLTIPEMLGGFLALLAMPWEAAPAHRLVFPAGINSPGFYVPAVIFAVLATALLVLVSKNIVRPLDLFCIAWVLAGILPRMYPYTLSQDHIVHDSYLYFSSFGFCLLLGDHLVRFAREGTRWRFNAACAAAASLLIAYATALWRLQPVWHDDITFFTQCVRAFPDSPYYRSGFADALQAHGDLSRARDELSIARRLVSPEILVASGKALVAEGYLKQGISEIADALNREKAPSPDDYMLLAELYDTAGDRAQSEAALKRTESLPGGEKAAGLARAQIAMQHGDSQKAEAIARGLADRYAEDYRVWLQLGLALSAQNHLDDALSAFRSAVELAPRNPILHFLAAQTLYQMHRDQEALEQCSVALKLRPDEPNARALVELIKADHSGH
jgi:protein O-mannosyl-transferase